MFRSKIFLSIKILTELQFQRFFWNVENMSSKMSAYNVFKNISAEMFISREEGFVKLYSFYCANYPNAVSLLSHLIQNNRAVFKKFQQIQAEMGHALPLGSYILKPVQRILKYHLILDEIVKHYSSFDRQNILLVHSFIFFSAKLRGDSFFLFLPLRKIFECWMVSWGVFSMFC